MKFIPTASPALPPGLKPHFQEYDPEALNFARDADLVIQRTLQFGTWEEVRWLFRLYGARRIRAFLRLRGERWLDPVAFNNWRKLLRIHKWKRSPFPTSRNEVWDFGFKDLYGTPGAGSRPQTT